MGGDNNPTVSPSLCNKHHYGESVFQDLTDRAGLAAKTPPNMHGGGRIANQLGFNAAGGQL